MRAVNCLRALRGADSGIRQCAIAGVAGLLASGAALAQAPRDYVSIVGSSTVYPFASVVAENFGRSTAFKTPVLESTGTGGGLKLFCGGVGVEHPDIANASRRIRASEVESCAANGVDSIIEVEIGYDGIALANSRAAAQYELSLREIYLALARSVPAPDGSEQLVPNPYVRWSDIRPELPNVAIEVLGPPPTSGTRDAFVELVMEPGCHSFEWIAAREDALDPAACQAVREDGAYVEVGENDNLIVQKLVANPSALGVFGYSYLEQNLHQVHGSIINGVEPNFDNIADGGYPISRPLYFYAKVAHVEVIPGLREYLHEFVSEEAAGEFGYLSDKGLIPLADAERRDVADRVSAQQPLSFEEISH